MLTFCGSKVDVDFDINEGDGKFSFRRYDNGEFKFKNPKTRHPNILKGVITAKKSWGLFLNEWSSGISEGLFTKGEILKEFEDNNIHVPEMLLIDFDNRINKKVIKVFQKSID